jgi:hypothetical protein
MICTDMHMFKFSGDSSSTGHLENQLQTARAKTGGCLAEGSPSWLAFWRDYYRSSVALFSMSSLASLTALLLFRISV